MLIINTQKPAAAALASEIRRALDGKGCTTALYLLDSAAMVTSGFDIAFSLGGDGTALFAARTMTAFGTPIIPLHLGTLGFIASAHPSRWLDVFSKWREGKLSEWRNAQR
ncbi:MAG: NAD(+)/NADH kinase [Spirochaetaceae bacterium]|jgi:NAD+ kinase|nr:NAD(+)/NADH kinase [Spirochaetaceae bacterium]